MNTEPRFPIHPLAIRVGLTAEAPGPYPRPIHEPREVFELLHEDVRTWDRERFITIALDGAHHILGLEEVAVGSLVACPVHPREVFKALILVNAAAFICVHNHPSGDPKPSPEDFRVTEVLHRTGEILGIALLDHIVVSANGYTSLQQEGALPSIRR